jgi:hypothetical protein
VANFPHFVINILENRAFVPNSFLKNKEFAKKGKKNLLKSLKNHLNLPTI